MVWVSNPGKVFLVGLGPYIYDPKFCSISFVSQTNYVYSVAAGTEQNASQSYFVYIGEDLVSENQIVGVIRYNTTNNPCTYEYANIQYFNYSHQEFYIVGVEPPGLYAYGQAADFYFVYNLNTYEINVQPRQIVLDPPFSAFPSFVPHALSMTENFVIVAGYGFDYNLGEYVPIACLIHLNPLTFDIAFVTFVPLLSDNRLVPIISAVDYSLAYDMSVAVNAQNQVLVGVPSFDSVVLLSVNATNLNIVNSITRYQSYTGFGKSVAWIDNTTAAILVYNLADYP
ncbi:unnamed protein product, partial [Didymodactylos carnosus]